MEGKWPHYYRPKPLDRKSINQNKSLRKKRGRFLHTTMPLILITLHSGYFWTNKITLVKKIWSCETVEIWKVIIIIGQKYREPRKITNLATFPHFHRDIFPQGTPHVKWRWNKKSVEAPWKFFFQVVCH